jgi:putative transposase
LYYKNKIKPISAYDIEIGNQIELIWRENRCKIGRWKIYWLLKQLRAKNKQSYVSEQVVRRIMKQRDIGARLTFKKDKGRTEDKDPRFRCSDKIKRGWKACKPFVKLYTDVTYLKTPWGFVYISSIIDGYNNAVLAWSTSRINDADAVVKMLRKLGVKVDGAIIHTDHGSVYTSHVYSEWLKKHRITRSMSRVGNSLDNYLIEHHFSNLKRECLWDILFAKRNICNIDKALTEYYYWYNNKRIQRYLDGHTPTSYVLKPKKKKIPIYNIFKRTSPVS